MNAHPDYQRTLESTATAEQAYEAVTSGFGKWWTDPKASLSRIGDVATFRFPPNQTFWTFRSISLRPFSLVEHECVRANHLHEGMPDSIRTEWLGTILRFQIEPKGRGSVVVFTHEGLGLELDCFEVCAAGWDHFFMDSLRSYLNAGKGMPHV